MFKCGCGVQIGGSGEPAAWNVYDEWMCPRCRKNAYGITGDYITCPLCGKRIKPEGIEQHNYWKHNPYGNPQRNDNRLIDNEE